MTAADPTALREALARTRQCSDCNRVKASSEFYRKSGRVGKHEARCKDCYNARIAQKRRCDDYRRSQNIAENDIRPAIGSSVKSNTPSQKMERARRLVRDAVKYGRLSKPSVCSVCGTNPGVSKIGSSLLQGHHHRGYDRPLDVVWLCVACHRKETPVASAERSGTAKIRTEEARKIRLLSAVGMSQREIARAFVLGKTTIAHCLAGRTWTGEPKWTK